MNNQEKLKKCQDFAIKEHEGLCLATEYINSKTKMPWRCKEGHKWMASYNSVIDHCTWCIVCAGKQKYTIDEVREFVKSIGYELISTKYKNQHTKLEIKCDKGHLFYPTFTNLKYRNSKCPNCMSIKNGLEQRLSFKEVKEFVESIGYELISTEYNGIHIPLKVKCDKGHIFYPEFNVLKNQGSRCGICNKISIEEVKKFIESINYELISTEYKTITDPLEVKCDKGHIFYPSFNNLKRGSRCSICSSFKTEHLCKDILEEKLEYNFIKKRFYYDTNNNKRFLEFDGYNKEHQIAFEYHGYQHYEFPNCFHKTEQQFLEGQLRDDYKEQFAAENDIKLLIIPYTENNNLEEYITKIIGEV